MTTPATSPPRPPLFQRIKDWWEPFLLRLSIALDDFVQAWLRDGVIGVTISSRTGTAADHGHGWGRRGEWMLGFWPFGPDPETGECHCTGAIKNDCRRAVRVIRSLLGDDTVVNKRSLHAFKKELLAEVQSILEE